MKKNIIILIWAICSPVIAFAQDTIPKKEKNVEFTPIPYLSYSQSQDLMYGGIGLATFRINRRDTVSPRSTAGVSAIGTTQGSYFIAGFAKLYFNEDKWRVTTMGGFGTYAFQTYIDDEDLESGFYDYASKTSMLTLRVLRKVYKKNYLGIGYHYDKTHTTFDELPTESVLTTNSLQFIYLHDSRDNVYYPTKGIKGSFIYTAYPKWMNDSESFGLINAYVNAYLPTKRENVWVFRAYSKFGTKSLDFQKQNVLGQVDLRGYTDGKYRGTGKFDLQTEFRYQLPKRFGLVGFTGLATIYGSDIEEFNWKLYPTIGLGMRYTAVQSTNMRFGIDVARGKDDWAVYFRIGESF